MLKGDNVIYCIDAKRIDENKYQIELKGQAIKIIDFWSKVLGIPVTEIIIRSLAETNNELKNKQMELEANKMIGRLPDFVRDEDGTALRIQP